jgi:AcrR family transcriptional regulator
MLPPSQPSSSSHQATRDRILDVSERLFAEFGFNGTSLRAITEAAGVNLAAVNYHFGDKETLYATVIRRRVLPVNTHRLAALDAAEQLAHDHPVPLRQVLEILVRPVFELSCDPALGGVHIVRLIGRTLSEPLPFTARLLQEVFDPVMNRFGRAIRRSVPHLSHADFMWRLNFAMGAMQHTLSTLHRIADLTHGACQPEDHAALLRRFLDFAEAGFSAPVAPDAANATSTDNLSAQTPFPSQ